MADDVKPGDYVGMFLDDKLVFTGVLKDKGQMESGRKVYQILLVKNMFQRNWPEIHFDVDVRPVTLDLVKEEIRRMKINLQKHIAQMETDPNAVIAEKELHNIVG
jgi:hypothetical protein